jgi:RHS repeat-associated protein
MLSRGLRLAGWIVTFVVTFFLGATSAKAQVWSNGYSYRSTITIDHTKVANTDQSNFPVLISGTYSALATTGNGGYVTSTSGYDIIFTSDAGGTSPLPFEQESYTSTSGQIIYWVQVPTLSHTSDTILYMFVGNSSVTTDQSTKNEVWDSNFKAVYHLANGTTLSGADSTSNGYDLTNSNSTAATSGQIDGAAIFNGTSNYLSNSSLEITAGSPITVSFWSYVPSSAVQSAVAFSIGGQDNPNRILLNAPWADDYLYWDYGSWNSGGAASIAYSSYLNSWTHVVVEYDPSTTGHFVYLNGALAASAISSDTPASNQSGLWIGAWSASNGDYHKGSIDEFRVSTVARSADWIATEYANQSGPSTFFAVASPEAGTTTPPTISSLSPSSAGISSSVTISGSNFGSTQGSSTVSFNGVSASVTSWGTTSVTVTVPSSATTGYLVMTVGGVTSNDVLFTLLPTPTISGLSSSAGPVGIPVTISGTNFGATQGSSAVTFNGVAATTASWSSTSIQATVPSGATTGNIVVTVSGIPSSGTSFTVTTGPGIIALIPSSGLAGTYVDLTGLSFGATQGSSSLTYDGTGLTPLSWSDTAISAQVPTSATTGPFVVNVAGQASNSATFTVTPFPSGWSDLDIGSVGATGSASFSNGIFTVEGSGYISGVSDTFNFLYQPLSGDGTIVARLLTMSGSSGTGQAGVMIRDSVSPTSTMALTGGQGTTSSAGAKFWYNSTTDNSTTYTTAAMPYWIKVVRSGDSFSSYFSWDGQVWNQIGSTQTISMSTNVYVGLAVSSESGSSLTTATFDNVSVTSTSAPPPVLSEVFPDDGVVGTHVVISGSGFGASQENGLVALNGIPLTITSWSDTSIVATIPTGATTGPIEVVVAPDMTASNPQLFVVGSQILSSWTDTDIGGATSVGTSSYSGDTFTLSGGTYTYGGTNFLSQPMTGDGTLVARVVSVSGTYGSNGPAVAGVMIRQTLDQESEIAFTNTCTGCNMNFTQSSYFNSNYSTQYSSGTVTLPYWVKLVRSVNTFTAYESVDGSNWYQVGTSQAIAMNSDVEVGLAVMDLNYGATATATFDNVSVSTDASPAPVIASLSTTTGPVGTGVTISGAGFGSSQGSSVAWVGSTAATVSSWSDSSVSITVPTGASSGPVSISLAPGMNESNAIFFTVTGDPLPTGWLDTDVGAVGIPGSASYTSSGSVFTLTASGANINSNVDGMHFVYQPLAGDGTITAEVTGISGGSGADQAGVMIRESLDPSAPHAMEGLQGTSSSSAVYFWDRPTLGAYTNAADNSLLGAVPTPYWVRVTRSGNTLTGNLSTDGITWGTTSTATVTMDTNVYVGLALSADTNSSAATATFTNVSVTLGSPTSNPVVNDLSPAIGGVGSSVTIDGSGFGATQGTSTVTFNGVPAYVVYWTNWEILAVVPTSATTGSVVVTVGTQPSNADFAYTIVDPQIQSLAPGSSPISGTVVLTGSGFGATQGSSYVLFAGTTSSAYISSWSDASITAEVPTGAVSGSVKVIVAGVFSNPAAIAVTGTLSVTALSPTAGQVGSTVTITGTGFGSTQGPSTVNFSGATASVVTWSDTSIVAAVPAGTYSGPVSVTVADLTADGPSFDISQIAYLTDSLGNNSSYLSTMIGGQWLVTTATGSGCSTCTLRGNATIGYDDNGQITSFTDPLGLTTSYGYSATAQLTSLTQPTVSAGTPTTTYTYDDLGDVLTKTDPLGHVTTYTYDTFQNLLTVTTPAPGTGPAASVTSFTYNSSGGLTQITDPRSHVWTITYTSTGMIHTITDPQSNVTTYAYDSRGNRTSITDALTHVTSFTYDMGNRLTQITYPDSTTTSFTYDVRGRRTSVTDQNGKTTTYAYDDADRLTSVTDPASNVTTYGYDSESNLTSITDANSHTTSFTYDAYGRVTKTTFPSSLYETYSYDADNNLTSKTDRKSQTIDYVYDALNRLSSKTYPDSTEVEFTYDLVGKLTGVTDPSGTYGFSYDNMDRLTGTTAQYSFLSGTTFTNAYTYDAASNRTGYTAPDSSTNTYSYDTLNRLTSLVSSASGSFGFSYDALNRRTQMTRPNGIDTNYSYDNLSRLLSVLHQSGTSTIDGASYTLDSVGNRTVKTDDYASVTSSYTYDPLYELTQVTQGSTTTESYSYDPVGNRTTSLGVSSYTTNSSNEVTANSNASYTYDNNGNTTSKTDSTGTTDYSWDYENRLASVTLPGSSGTVTFKYDPFGRRIEKISPTTTSIFAYDGDSLVETTNASGSQVAGYTLTQNIDEPLAMNRGGTVDYYEQDGLGAVTSLTSVSGSVAQTYTYDSFANTTGSSGSLTNFFRYTAREFDTETNLYFYRTRYYAPSSGRFLSEDPLHFATGPNFYSYVGNEPTDFLDPLGLCPCAPKLGHPSMGLSGSIATVNPFTSGNGGVWGKNAQSFGPDTNHYNFSGKGFGLDVGGSIQSSWAWGSGNWTGVFRSINISGGPFAGSIYWTPGKGGWVGFSFGLGIGFPGLAYEETNYTCEPIP